MSIEANKELIRRQYEEITNGKNLAMVETYFTPDFLDHEAPAGQPLADIDAALLDQEQPFGALVLDEDRGAVGEMARDEGVGELGALGFAQSREERRVGQVSGRQQAHAKTAQVGAWSLAFSRPR